MIRGVIDLRKIKIPQHKTISREGIVEKTKQAQQKVLDEQMLALCNEIDSAIKEAADKGISTAKVETETDLPDFLVEAIERQYLEFSASWTLRELLFGEEAFFTFSW